MRAVITGAAGGIGAAIARRLAGAREQPRLLLVDVAEDGLLQTARETKAAGAETVTMACDLSSSDAGDAVIAEAQRTLGGLDALLSNAGIVRPGKLGKQGTEAYDLTFAVNARATWLLARAAFPLLRETPGCLVATGSLGAEHPTPGIGSYSPSKAALVMIVKQLAFEWGPYGIRCNCVSPGAVHTPMTEAKYSDPASESRRAREAAIPLGRVADPSEIAAAVEFLASPAASYVTGVNLPVDGGWSTALCRP